MKFALQRYEDRHAGFVFSEVRRAASKFPYALPGVLEHVMQARLTEMVRRAIVGNPRGALVAAADDDPDLFLGYLVSPGPQAVTFAYSKYALRHQGICSALLEALSIDPSRPISVSIWSPAASRMAAKGWRLFPAVIERQEYGSRESETTG